MPGKTIAQDQLAAIFLSGIEVTSTDVLSKMIRECNREFFRRQPKHPTQILQEWMHKSRERDVDYNFRANKPRGKPYTLLCVLNLFDGMKIESFSVFYRGEEDRTKIKKAMRKEAAVEAIRESTLLC